jgi:hypothetical protein
MAAGGAGGAKIKTSRMPIRVQPRGTVTQNKSRARPSTSRTQHNKSAAVYVVHTGMVVGMGWRNTQQQQQQQPQTRDTTGGGTYVPNHAGRTNSKIQAVTQQSNTTGRDRTNGRTKMCCCTTRTSLTKSVRHEQPQQTRDNVGGLSVVNGLSTWWSVGPFQKL